MVLRFGSRHWCSGPILNQLLCSFHNVVLFLALSSWLCVGMVCQCLPDMAEAGLFLGDKGWFQLCQGLYLWDSLPIWLLDWLCQVMSAILACGHYRQDPNNLLSEKEIRSYPAKPWQPRTIPATHKWIQDALTSREREQLTSMDNIVVPEIANFAANLLCRAWNLCLIPLNRGVCWQVRCLLNANWLKFVE